MATEQATGPRAPYVPFRTFWNFVEEMAGEPEAVPEQIDASVLSGKSGATRSQLLIALRFFELVEGEGDRTSDQLRELVRKEEAGRQSWLAGALRQHYSDVLALSEKKGTAKQLSDHFQDKHQYQRSTRDKAIRFFLQAAKFAGIAVSPHFSLPPSPASRPKRSTGSGTRQPNAEVPVEPPAQLPVPNAEPRAHPLILGLVDRLPPEGEEWRTEEREKWLIALQAFFDLLYKDEAVGAKRVTDPSEEVADEPF